MSTTEEKFDRAVKIVQGLPKDGPIKPTQEDQLDVRSDVPFLQEEQRQLTPNHSSVLQVLQAG